MKKEFNTHKAVEEVCDITYKMWEMGWDEKNGGNISIILEDEEAHYFKDEFPVIELANIPNNLVGKYILITASGSEFRLVKENKTNDLGVIKIETEGYKVVWGFENGSRPTSEIYMHLLSHSTRLKNDETHRVVVHNHATDVLKMTFVHELDDYSFTKSLWRIITECVVVFPDGVSILPWMVCGTEEIGLATAEKLESSRIVVWAYHGILATGSSIKDAFGLIETVNKAAKIYCETLTTKIADGISDEELGAVCEFFDIQPKEGYLKINN